MRFCSFDPVFRCQHTTTAFLGLVCRLSSPWTTAQLPPLLPSGCTRASEQPGPIYKHPTKPYNTLDDRDYTDRRPGHPPTGNSLFFTHRKKMADVEPRLAPFLLPEQSRPRPERRLTIEIDELVLRPGSQPDEEEEGEDSWTPVVLVNFQFNAESISKPARHEGKGRFVWDHKATLSVLACFISIYYVVQSILTPSLFWILGLGVVVGQTTPFLSRHFSFSSFLPVMWF
jgi:hypothetical protein